MSDLTEVKQPVAVLTVELPLRRAGFILPQWCELLKLRQWCDQHGVHFHMDGARIWESAPFYDQSFAEISKLFDSVYVSLYKGIGGISGALLLGDENLVMSCDTWRNRLGSNMWTTFPALITALEGLDNNLQLIPQWVQRAKQLAHQLMQLPGIRIEQQHTNAFQLKINHDNNAINHQLEQLSAEHGLQICKTFKACSDPSWAYTEIQVGADHCAIKDDEILNFFHVLLNRLKSTS